jgi:(2Fe-2S) ferredoxin
VTRVLVGLGTCGIAAGAEDTLRAVTAKLGAAADGVELARAGCIGMCYREPLVEIRHDDGARFLYGPIAADRVERLLDEHIGQN